MNGRGQEISVANPVNETISYQTHYVCERREQEGEEEVGPGEGAVGQALEKEGERQGRCGTRAHGFQGSRRVTSRHLGGIAPVPGRLCSPQKGPVVKTVPWSELPAGLLGAPSLPCQLSEPGKKQDPPSALLLSPNPRLIPSHMDPQGPSPIYTMDGH